MNKENCEICQLAVSKDRFTVYEDDVMKALLVPKPSSPGHILLFPKQHHTIFEQVPDSEVDRIFAMANKMSTAVFESLNMHGTNLLINNGTAAGQQHSHFSLDIVPRMENDGLKLEWKPKQLSEEEMSTVELTLKPHTEVMTHDRVSPKEEPVKEEKKAPLLDDSSSYLVRQLRRIP
jgi:histidine triad (HIT) family protein